MTKNEKIIEALIKFLKKQGEWRYDVPDLITAKIKNSRVFITGAVGRDWPEPFMKALGITRQEELFEALKSVNVNQTIGQSSPFSALFSITEGGE